MLALNRKFAAGDRILALSTRVSRLVNDRFIGHWPLFRDRNTRTVLLLSGAALVFGLAFPWRASKSIRWAGLAMVVLAGLLISVLVQQRKRFWLGLLIFFIPLNVDMNFIMRQSLGGAEALNLGIVDLLLLLLMFFWLQDVNAGQAPWPRQIYSTIAGPFLAIIGLSILSLLVAQDVVLGVFDILQWLKAFLLYFFLVHHLNTRADVEWILRLLFIGVVFQSAILFFQHIQGGRIGLIGLGEAPEVLQVEINALNVVRPGGTIGHCNHLSRYIALILPVAMVFTLMPDNGRRPLLPALTCVAGGLALVLTLTRSAWLATIVALAVIIVLSAWLRLLTPRFLLRLTLAGLVLLSLMAFYGSLIKERITADDLGSGRTRITTARVAWNIIKDHPLLGVGINNYGTVLEKYWDPSDGFTRRAAVHNTYLLLAAEIGLPGLAAFMFLLFRVLNILWRSIPLDDVGVRKIAIGFFSSYLGLFLMALTDKSYKENTPLLFLLAVTMALVVANYRTGTQPIIRMHKKQMEDRQTGLPG